MRLTLLSCLLLLSLGTPRPGQGGMFFNPGAQGQPWRFDGREFVPGAGDGAVVLLLRAGYLPLFRTEAAVTPSIPLPDGMGAVAGICYIQTAGGKLASGGGPLLVERCPIEVMDSSRHSRQITADNHGFFALPLPPGLYELRTAAGRITLAVTTGRSSLAALRVGKRMVD